MEVAVASVGVAGRKVASAKISPKSTSLDGFRGGFGVWVLANLGTYIRRR